MAIASISNATAAFQAVSVLSAAATTTEASSAADEPLTETTVPSVPAIEDELTLSDEAQAAADKTESGSLRSRLQEFLPGVPRGPGNTIQLSDIREYYSERLSSLNSDIRAAMAEAGIDTSQEIRLQVGYDGSVLVSNDHPQSAEIEQIFKTDEDLRNRFAEVSALGSFIQAADQAVGFQAAYRRDPEAAVRQYAYLFSQSAQMDYTLVISGGRTSKEYE